MPSRIQLTCQIHERRTGSAGPSFAVLPMGQHRHDIDGIGRQIRRCGVEAEAEAEAEHIKDVLPRGVVERIRFQVISCQVLRQPEPLFPTYAPRSKTPREKAQ